jgi:starvation-inducible DNA-binding protein
MRIIIVDKVILSLKAALADSFVFYYKAHQSHWNVEGVLFAQFHDLFSKIYEEVYDSIDTLAEELRALDAYAPMSTATLRELSSIEEESITRDARGMAQALLDDISIVMKSLEMTYHFAELEHQHGLSNLMAERQDAFKKHRWMLRSTLKE